MFQQRLVPLCVLLFVLFWGRIGSADPPQFTSYSELAEQFRDPSAAFRPAPLWVWHDKVSKQMIDRDLKDLKAHGFGGVFIHPRYGLITEYLSDQWFELARYTNQQSKKLGLNTWIYDENSFPSGFAGGHVPAQMPESYNQGQGFVMQHVTVIPADVAKYEIVLSGGPPSTDVTGKVEPGNKGDYYLFDKVFYPHTKWFAGYTYVDLLVPGVTEKFIEITMGGYEKVVGADFGKNVPGVFTDEPNIQPPHGQAIRWTPALFAEFQNRWGYDLKTRLPSLFEEVGNWKRVRHNHYQLLLELFIRYWSRPWHEYTEKHNLKWTGHYWEHGWPNPQHGGDNMAMYAWHQMPAVDMLFNTMDQDSIQFGNIRAVKELRSVANQMGRTRTLSETYGAAGWELRFEDMKRLGDWEYVLGVNFMNQHLTYMNLTGDRKHDFPQGISYQTPWWKHYKVLNDYFARLSVALSSGRQVNRTLVLVPTSTTWMYYAPGNSNAQLARIGDSFHKFVTELEKYQIEYDLGCENIIADHGKIDGKSFVIGQGRYDTVVLPPSFENLDKPTFKLLKKYVAAGGHVLAFGDPPPMLDGAPHDGATQLTQKPNWQRADSIASVRDQLTIGELKFLHPETVTGNLLHMRRELQDGQLLFLTNSSLTAAAQGTLLASGASAVLLDPLTGRATPYAVQTQEGRVKIAFDVAPAGSLLLFIARHGKPTAVTDPHLTRSVLPSPDSEVTRRKPNMLTLDYCDVQVGGQQYKGVYYYSAGTKIWEAHGYKENPWVSSVQWKTDLVDADTFADGTGFEARYPFQVDEGVDIASLRAVVERPDLWQVEINGQRVQASPGKWAIDKTFGLFEIGKHVKPGHNEIAVIRHPMSIFAELEPVTIMGNFDLQSQPHGWKLTKQTPMHIGSWKDQGLPFYPYDVAYAKMVKLPKCNRVVVRLGKWQGTVAEVRVNGRPAGIIGWQPYELDITSLTKAGSNKIEVIVTGSFKNLLGPHHNVTRRGIVTPWSFKSAPAPQGVGLDYDLLDYGLLEDFSVVVWR